MKSEEKDLLRAAHALIQRARQADPRYATGHGPMSTGDFSRMVGQLHCRRVLVRLKEGEAQDVRAGALPPIGGYNWIAVRDDLDVWERTYAERHELGHILNGDAEEFMSIADWGGKTWGERKVDLFAMADVLPRQWFESLRRAGLSWRAVVVEVRRAIQSDFGPGWPIAKVRDRARLRVQLFREHGI